MVHPIVKDRVGLASRGYAGVVKGTRHKAAAEFYINELISEGMQEVLHTRNGIVPTNSKVQVKYSGKPKLDSTGGAVPHALAGSDRESLLHGHVGVQHEGLDPEVESHRRLPVR